MVAKSPFAIPGLFRLNLIIVDLPTGGSTIGDRGNKIIQSEKVALLLQLDPVRSMRTMEDVNDGGRMTGSTFYEGSIVPCNDTLPGIPDGAIAWNSQSLPPALLPGTVVPCQLNGLAGNICFRQFGQSCFLPAYQAGFGDRLLVEFQQQVRGGDGV